MTSPSRRKRPTTARGPSTPAPTTTRPWLAAAVALACLLSAWPALAQGPGAPPVGPYQGRPATSGMPAATTWAGAPQPVPTVQWRGEETPGQPVRFPLLPAVDAGEIQLTRYQPPGPGAGMGGRAAADDKDSTYPIQLEPPGLERLSRLDSEEKLQKRIEQETRGRVGGSRERITFPESPILSRDQYAGRGPVWPQRQMTAEPNYLLHGRLYFEERNSERYGWEFGLLQPALSTGIFFADLVLLPYHWGTEPFRCHDSSAGKCLPGDPVPYRLYPQGASLSGAAAEVAVILALVAIFP